MAPELILGSVRSLMGLEATNPPSTVSAEQSCEDPHANSRALHSLSRIRRVPTLPIPPGRDRPVVRSLSPCQGGQLSGRKKSILFLRCDQLFPASGLVATRAMAPSRSRCRRNTARIALTRLRAAGVRMIVRKMRRARRRPSSSMSRRDLRRFMGTDASCPMMISVALKAACNESGVLGQGTPVIDRQRPGADPDHLGEVAAHLLLGLLTALSGGTATKVGPRERLGRHQPLGTRTGDPVSAAPGDEMTWDTAHGLVCGNTAPSLIPFSHQRMTPPLAATGSKTYGTSTRTATRSTAGRRPHDSRLPSLATTDVNTLVLAHLAHAALARARVEVDPGCALAMTTTPGVVALTLPEDVHRPEIRRRLAAVARDFQRPTDDRAASEQRVLHRARSGHRAAATGQSWLGLTR